MQGERLSAKGAHRRKKKKRHRDFAYSRTVALFPVIMFIPMKSWIIHSDYQKQPNAGPRNQRPVSAPPKLRIVEAGRRRRHHSLEENALVLSRMLNFNTRTVSPSSTSAVPHNYLHSLRETSRAARAYCAAALVRVVYLAAVPLHV